MSRHLLFWFNYNFSSTSWACIDLTTCAGKTVAAATVGQISLKGHTAVMTEDQFNQFIHMKDESFIPSLQGPHENVHIQGRGDLYLPAVAVLDNQLIVQAIVHLQYGFHFALGIGS